MKNDDLKIITNYVSSSTIKQVDYDPLMENMIVCFKNNVIYEYYNVPRETYDQLILSPSIGKFFHQNIKSKFEFAKRGEIQEQVKLDFSETEKNK